MQIANRNNAVLYGIAEMVRHSVNPIRLLDDHSNMGPGKCRVFINLRAKNGLDESRWAFNVGDLHTLSRVKDTFQFLLGAVGKKAVEYRYLSDPMKNINHLDGIAIAPLVGKEPTEDQEYRGVLSVTYHIDYTVNKRLTLVMKTDRGPGPVEKINVDVKGKSFFSEEL